MAITVIIGHQRDSFVMKREMRKSCEPFLSLPPLLGSMNLLPVLFFFKFLSWPRFFDSWGSSAGTFRAITSYPNYNLECKHARLLVNQGPSVNRCASLGPPAAGPASVRLQVKPQWSGHHFCSCRWTVRSAVSKSVVNECFVYFL